MTIKFIHLQGNHQEIVINIEQITSVSRTDSLTAIYLAGDETPIKLSGESAQSFWNFMLDRSPTIYSAALDNKNAESLTEQESSD